MLLSNQLILCHSLFLLPLIFLSIKVFFNESSLCIRWSRYWSFSFSISPSNEYSGLINLGLTDLIVQSRGLSRVFSRTTIQKHQFFGNQPSLWSNSHIHTRLLKNHSFDYMDFSGQVLSLLFNTLSKFVIAFLPWIIGFVSNTTSQWQITHNLHIHSLSSYASAHFQIRYSVIYLFLTYKRVYVYQVVKMGSYFIKFYTFWL